MVNPTGGLGDFEQLVLLAILQLGPGAHAPAIRDAIERAADRTVTRGALYSTLDRLDAKGLISWSPEPGPTARGGVPRRLFSLTSAGLGALRRTWSALTALARGVEGHLGSVS